VLGHSSVFSSPQSLVPPWNVARIAQWCGRGLSDHVSDLSRVLTGTTPEAPGRSSSSIVDHHDEVRLYFPPSPIFFALKVSPLRVASWSHPGIQVPGVAHCAKGIHQLQYI